MKQDDIEKILQQYGEDKRQQQQIADNLHRMAQRQSRRRIGIAGVVTLLLCATLTLRLLSPQQNTGLSTAATHSISAPKPATIIYPSNNHIPSLAPTPTHRKPPIKETASDIIRPTDNNDAVTDSQRPETTTVPDYAAEQQNNDTETQPTNREKTENSSVPSLQQLPELFAEQTNTTPVTNGIKSIPLLRNDNTSRISFTSSIIASTVTNYNIGYAEENATDELNFVAGESFSSLDPNFSLSASIGAAYIVASSRSFRIDIGMTLSGRVQQGAVNDYTVENAGNNSITTDDNLMTIKPNGHHPYTTFDLFANVPITLNFFPMGKDKTGWSLNITPAHSIVRTHMQSASTVNPFVVNTWKLNVGLGIVLPRKVIHRLALTANLLPLYTSRSIHEIGFEIGF